MKNMMKKQKIKKQLNFKNRTILDSKTYLRQNVIKQVKFYPNIVFEVIKVNNIRPKKFLKFFFFRTQISK